MRARSAGRPCGCGERGPDDLVLCERRGASFIVECKLCGEQWKTRAKYAQVLALDYAAGDWRKT